MSHDHPKDEAGGPFKLRPDMPTEGPSDTSALTPRPPRKRRKLKAMAFFLALCTLVVGGLWTALEIEPQAVRAQREFVDSARPEEMVHLSETMEARLYESLGFAKSDGAPAAGPFSGRPGSLVLEPQGSENLEAARTAIDDLKRPRKFTLTSEEANAWIATNFKEWMEYRGYELPEQITNPLVAVDGSQLLMSFDYTGRHVSQTFTAEFWLDFQPSGTAKLKVTALSAGSVPIPLERIGEYLAEHTSDSDTAQQVGDWLAKLEDAEFKPVMKLKDRMRALVIDYQVIDGKIEVTLVLEDRSGIYAGKPQAKSISKSDLVITAPPSTK